MADPDLTYIIDIRLDPADMDADTKDDILNAAEPNDVDGGLRRFVGDILNDIEGDLNSKLPEGFWAKIREGDHD